MLTIIHIDRDGKLVPTFDYECYKLAISRVAHYIDRGHLVLNSTGETRVVYWVITKLSTGYSITVTEKDNRNN